MHPSFASFVVAALGAYAGIGLLFAIPFVTLGVQRIDGAAAGASLGFRLLVLPGCVLLWPLLLGRWLRRASPPAERNAHRERARAASGDRRPGP